MENDQPHNQTLLSRILAMGFLRNMLQLSGLVFALLMPISGLPNYTSEWNLFFNGVVPAMAPLIVILIMLDVMMSHIWKDGESEERIAELNFIMRCHLIVAGLLLLAFLGMFLPVLLP